MALNESDFEALGVIGEGSYGTVVKARERATGRLVAIKKFRDAELDKTTKRELEALRRVRHPGVCALVATHSERGKLRIAMEYVGGGTLLDVLEAHPRGVPAPRAASLARSLVDAVAGMHGCGVLHRDLKPENVLLATDCTIKLCDLGDATWIDNGAAGRTSYVATRWYRAPELLVRSKAYGAAIDIWAVGCIAFEILTGEPLFGEKTDASQLGAIQRCLGPLPDNLLGGAGRRAAPADAVEKRRCARASRAWAARRADGESFLSAALRLKPNTRPKARQLLTHAAIRDAAAPDASPPASVASAASKASAPPAASAPAKKKPGSRIKASALAGAALTNQPPPAPPRIRAAPERADEVVDELRRAARARPAPARLAAPPPIVSVAAVVAAADGYYSDDFEEGGELNEAVAEAEDWKAIERHMAWLGERHHQPAAKRAPPPPERAAPPPAAVFLGRRRRRPARAARRRRRRRCGSLARWRRRRRKVGLARRVTPPSSAGKPPVKGFASAEVMQPKGGGLRPPKRAVAGIKVASRLAAGARQRPPERRGAAAGRAGRRRRRAAARARGGGRRRRGGGDTGALRGAKVAARAPPPRSRQAPRRRRSRPRTRRLPSDAAVVQPRAVRDPIRRRPDESRDP